MHKKALLVIKRITLLAFVFIQMVFYPAAAFAETTDDPTTTPTSTTQTEQETPQEQPPTNEQQTQDTSSQNLTGPQSPPGPASNSYHQNPDGTWSNDYYTWDPVTGQTRPNTPQTYSYNPTSGMWDTTEWYYSPEQGRYLPNTVSSTNPPAGSNPSTAATVAPMQNGTISGTGPDSTNAINFGGNTDGTFNLFYDATISNAIGQLSRSGDANVIGNTLGGNATSGDASTLANLLNMIQSSWGQLGSNDISTFVANLDGNVVGDLYIDPSGLPAGGGNTDLDVNVAQNGAIHNDIDATAQSGHATVSGNTTGGNATSGNAQVVINLMNLINSAITANQSFMGVLNINGNFDGDILLPDGMLQAIIAATGPHSQNSIDSQDNDSLDVSVDESNTILNNVDANAQSGNVNVSDNTSGGNATSGAARNNVTLLNLTGQHVVAKNAMLVFVNVLGEWVGLIMNAPAGSYAVAATGPDSTNTISSNNNSDVDVNVDSHNLIENNITANAQSGDASVTHNTTGGNATSGDADTSVNILNMIDSSFDVSDWFGVLFINVFGKWHGSFGVNTDAGNPQPNATVGGRGAGPDQTSNVSTTPQTFTFVPQTNQGSGSSTSTTDSNQTSNQNAVLAAAQNIAELPQALGQDAGPTTKARRTANLVWSIGGVGIALSLLALERWLSFRGRRS